MRILGLGAAGTVAGCSTDEGTPTEGDDGTPGDDGTATPTEDQLPEVGGTYIAADATDAQTMYHPENADANTDTRISLILDGAYAITDERAIFGHWLEDVENTGDSQVYVATVRDNLEWGAGYGQQTAEDWVYHIQEVHQGGWAGSQAAGDWAGITVEQTGQLEFQIELSEQNADWPYEPTLAGSYCLPKALTEQYAPDEDLEGIQQDEEIQEIQYGGNLGPYTWEAWDREAEFRAVRNDEYYMRDVDEVPDAWSEAPFFDEYVIRVIEEETTRLQALRSDEITTSAIPLNRVSDFEDVSSLDIYNIPQPFMSMAVYNQRANGWEPLRIAEVRQALSTAIDKSVIVEQILRGNADFSFTFQPRWSTWYDDSTVEEFGYQDSYGLDQARSMLEDNLPSDWGYNGSDEVVGPDGEQVELTHVYSEGVETTATTAEYMQQQLQELGFAYNLVTLQFNRMQDQYLLNSPPEDADPEWTTPSPFNGGPRDVSTSAQPWDIMSGIGFNTYPFAPTGTETFWYERSPLNYYGYVPSVDMPSKFDSLRTESDPAAREDIFAEILGTLSTDQPVNFLSMSDTVQGYQNYVEGPVEVFSGNYDDQLFHFTNL